MHRQVVVTGIGAVTPLGVGVEEFWRRLCAGESGVRSLDSVPALAGRESPIRFGAPVDGFDAAQHFTRKELQRLSRSSQLALVAAKEAMAMARLDAQADKQTLDATAVILGCSITIMTSSETFFYRALETGIQDPLMIPVSMNLAPAASIALKWGCHGPLFTVDAACASSNQAIGMALSLIRSGTVDRVITGAGESPFAPEALKAWHSMHAVSDSYDPPAQACRPFSKDRAGMVLGEHGAILVLESEATARMRGAPILATVAGYGASSDAVHLTQPSVDGPVRAMRAALADAGLTTEDVDYISAHGTGTLLNDRTECLAIKQMFGPRVSAIPVVSIKGAVGHSLAASGALELVSCVMTLRHGRLPPTINLREPDPDCDLDFVPDSARSANVRHAVSNSFAFGGSNATLVLSQATIT